MTEGTSLLGISVGVHITDGAKCDEEGGRAAQPVTTAQTGEEGHTCKYGISETTKVERLVIVRISKYKMIFSQRK